MWVVDPIDGTRGFAQKNGEFSVMIALLVEGPSDGRRCAGTRDPSADLCGARRAAAGGRTATRAPAACRVTTTRELSEATLTQSRSRKTGERSPLVQALQPKSIRETYSAGIKLALVARGDADYYVNSYEAFHDWDISAGQILVEEAGGVVTGLGGDPHRLRHAGRVAAAGAVGRQRLASCGRRGALPVAVMLVLHSVGRLAPSMNFSITPFPTSWTARLLRITIRLAASQGMVKAKGTPPIPLRRLDRIRRRLDCP